jgi:hypothetical protein
MRLPQNASDKRVDKLVQSNLDRLGIGPDFGLKLQSVTRDSRFGQTSQAVAADFSQADPGGPTLSAVSFSGPKLKIKGTGLSGDIEVEINALIVVAGANGSSKKVVVKGNASSLNLRNGPNRIRVRNGALWSNILNATI